MQYGFVTELTSMVVTKPGAENATVIDEVKEQQPPENQMVHYAKQSAISNRKQMTSIRSYQYFQSFYLDIFGSGSPQSGISYFGLRMQLDASGT